MKKILLVLALLFTMSISFVGNAKMPQFMDSRVEVVNEKTVIFKNVIKIEIRTNFEDQITYVYDIKRGRMAKIAKGAFEVDLPMGDYLVQSTMKITKTAYETHTEI